MFDIPKENTNMNTNEPLASKLRPENIEEFIGQKHLVGENMPLRVAINNKHLFSMLFWGPPGVGKTTLAKIYAKSLDANLYELSAVSAGKDDIRKIVADSEADVTRPKVLFLDEIHKKEGWESWIRKKSTSESCSVENRLNMKCHCNPQKMFLMQLIKENTTQSLLG